MNWISFGILFAVKQCFCTYSVKTRRANPFISQFTFVFWYIRTIGERKKQSITKWEWEGRKSGIGERLAARKCVKSQDIRESGKLVGEKQIGGNSGNVQTQTLSSATLVVFTSGYTSFVNMYLSLGSQEQDKNIIHTTFEDLVLPTPFSVKEGSRGLN